ncbi:hypothetical protein G7Y89_g12160 [Cudoniella acicularis]|uniref:CCHC-type domain-containing protein n=1 Tax=Cudoniella acicularis TaxID=354080 RepID=A0A8H4RAL6_9HELO|nr:hypothetical protein G7Y89_g12160 [Cudoniella acicularis]
MSTHSSHGNSMLPNQSNTSNISNRRNEFNGFNGFNPIAPASAQQMNINFNQNLPRGEFNRRSSFQPINGYNAIASASAQQAGPRGGFNQGANFQRGNRFNSIASASRRQANFNSVPNTPQEDFNQRSSFQQRNGSNPIASTSEQQTSLSYMPDLPQAGFNQQPSSQQRKDVFCQLCKRKGHRAEDCKRPGGDGFMNGCPECETPGHDFKDCRKLATMSDSRKYHICVVLRMGAPMWRSSEDLRKLINPATGKNFLQENCCPWTPAFALQKANVWRTHKYMENYQEEDTIYDATWEQNPSEAEVTWHPETSKAMTGPINTMELTPFVMQLSSQSQETSTERVAALAMNNLASITQNLINAQAHRDSTEVQREAIRAQNQDPSMRVNRAVLVAPALGGNLNGTQVKESIEELLGVSRIKKRKADSHVSNVDELIARQDRKRHRTNANAHGNGNGNVDMADAPDPTVQNDGSLAARRRLARVAKRAATKAAGRPGGLFGNIEAQRVGARPGGLFGNLDAQRRRGNRRGRFGNPNTQRQSGGLFGNLDSERQPGITGGLFGDLDHERENLLGHTTLLLSIEDRTQSSPTACKNCGSESHETNECKDSACGWCGQINHKQPGCPWLKGKSLRCPCREFPKHAKSACKEMCRGDCGSTTSSHLAVKCTHRCALCGSFKHPTQSCKLECCPCGSGFHWGQQHGGGCMVPDCGVYICDKHCAKCGLNHRHEVCDSVINSDFPNLIPSKNGSKAGGQRTLRCTKHNFAHEFQKACNECVADKRTKEDEEKRRANELPEPMQDLIDNQYGGSFTEYKYDQDERATENGQKLLDMNGSAFDRFDAESADEDMVEEEL